MPLPPERIIVAVTGMAMHGVEGEILQGIQRYAHTHRWQIFNGNTPTGRREMLRNQRHLSGIIAIVADDQTYAELKDLDCPVVNLSDTFPEKYGFPAVIPDDQRIGQLAADYFCQRGYRHFAVQLPPGVHPYRYLNTRTQAFVEALEVRGFGCFGIRELLSEEDRERVRRAGFISPSFRDLPKPCAVFCPDDQMASHVCFVAQTAGIAQRIPEEIAVLGVDNFALHCNMTSPPLSSIDVNAQRIGEEAAGLLHRMMEGEQSRDYCLIEVPPGEIVIRDSAATTAIQNIHLARAIQFILEHCYQRINVNDIVRASGVNRRKLEILFRDHYHRTILQELNLARIDRAQKLRRDTDLPLYKIATLSGFRDSHQMNRVLERHGQAILDEKTARSGKA